MTIGEIVDQLSKLPRDWKAYIFSDAPEYEEGWAEVDLIINRSIYEEEGCGLINFIEEEQNSVEFTNSIRDDLIIKEISKEDIKKRLSNLVDKKEMQRWLGTENILLGNKKPIDCFHKEEDLKKLDQLLIMIEEGIHV